MHEYSVAFDIAGDDLNESELSRMLGLSPTVFLEKGERMSPRRQRKKSVWRFEVWPSAQNPAWGSLEDGLICLLKKLLPLKNVLIELRQRYSIEAYCGHFGSGFGGGPSLSPETLGMLTDLGLTLTIKTYWQDQKKGDGTTSQG